MERPKLKLGFIFGVLGRLLHTFNTQTVKFSQMFSIFFLNIFEFRGNTERYDDTVIRLTVTVYGYSYYSYYNLQSMHDDKRDSIRRAAITGEVLLLLKRNEAAQL